MKKLILHSVTVLMLANAAFAQTDITSTMTAGEAAKIVRIAVPFPELKPPTAPAPALVDATKVREGFFGPLTRDIAYSGFFARLGCTRGGSPGIFG